MALFGGLPHATDGRAVARAVESMAAAGRTVQAENAREVASMRRVAAISHAVETIQRCWRGYFARKVSFPQVGAAEGGGRV
jgi:hypothetical protein